MKAQEVRDYLAKSTIQLGELHADITRKLATRRNSEEDWRAWSDACALFHKSYDELAFPGGLEQAFTFLKAGKTTMAEAALIYCEIRPYYFRSGYNRSKFLRLLGRLTLPAHLKARLKMVKDEVHRRKLESRRRLEERWAPKMAESQKKL